MDTGHFKSHLWTASLLLYPRLTVVSAQVWLQCPSSVAHYGLTVQWGCQLRSDNMKSLSSGSVWALWSTLHLNLEFQLSMLGVNLRKVCMEYKPLTLRFGGVLKMPEQIVSPSWVQVTDTSSGQKSLMQRCSVHSCFNRGLGGSHLINITSGAVPVKKKWLLL